MDTWSFFMKKKFDESFFQPIKTRMAVEAPSYRPVTCSDFYYYGADGGVK